MEHIGTIIHRWILKQRLKKKSNYTKAIEELNREIEKANQTLNQLKLWN